MKRLTVVVVVVLCAVGVSNAISNRVPITKQMAIAIAKDILAPDPHYRPSSGERYRGVEIGCWRLLMPSRGGILKVQKLKGPQYQGCGKAHLYKGWVTVAINIYDGNGQELAQGGLELAKQVKDGKRLVWRIQAVDEGVGIPEQDIRQKGIPEDVIKEFHLCVLTEKMQKGG